MEKSAEKKEGSGKSFDAFRKARPFLFWPVWSFLMLKLPRTLLVRGFYHTMAVGGAAGHLAERLVKAGMAGMCVTGLCCALALCAGLLHAQFVEGKRPTDIWGPVRQPVSRALCMASIGFLFVTALSEIFYLLLPSVQEGYARDMTAAFGAGRTTVVYLLVHVFLTPVTEETVFRGIIYKSLRKENGLMLSACFCALLFGLYHDVPLQRAYTAVLGLLLCLITEKYRSLTCPVLLHMSFNLWGSGIIPIWSGSILVAILSLSVIVKYRKVL